MEYTELNSNIEAFLKDPGKRSRAHEALIVRLNEILKGSEPTMDVMVLFYGKSSYRSMEEIRRKASSEAAL